MKRLASGVAVCLLVATSQATAMEVFIKEMTGKEITVDVELSDTIDTLKKKIADTDGIKAECQKLIWSGNLLQSDKTIADYGIGADATIHMIQHC